MLNNFKSSWHLFIQSFRVFGKYPILIVPIVASWCVYAPVVLWLEFFAPWDSLGFGGALLVIFGAIWLFSLALSLSCGWVLEIIQQIESDQTPSLGDALGQLLARDLKAILPLSLVWAVIWFILTLLEAIFSRRRSNNGNQSLSTENAAKVLSGDGPFSWLRLGFEMLQKAVRMVVFMILPAIAWEDLGFASAVKRGITVLRKTFTQFVSGFVLTEAAATIVFLPPAIVFELADKHYITMTQLGWYVCIVYIAIATSYSIYLEQMFTAELFLWYTVWEKAAADAQANGQPAPKLTDVPMPSVIDGIPDIIPPDDLPGTTPTPTPPPGASTPTPTV